VWLCSYLSQTLRISSMQEMGEADIGLHDCMPRQSANYLLCLAVTKAQETTIFSVEPTGYGWSVSDGAKRLGLFVSQRQALDEVKKQRAVLKAKGRASSVEVTGAETEGARRPQRFY
jgi:hypothetical protein